MLLSRHRLIVLFLISANTLFALAFVSTCAAMVVITVPSSNIDALVQRSLDVLDAAAAAAAAAAEKQTGSPSSSSTTATSEQVFIGIAGGPGSGKSSVAESVCKALNDRHKDHDHRGENIAIVIPMDGYHYSQDELRAMANEQSHRTASGGGGVIGDLATGKNGAAGGGGSAVTTFDDLMSRRGAPWTFDSHALLQDLQWAKQEKSACFPTYSREIRDPIPNAIALTSNHMIVLCEGNYLLALDEEEWKPLERLWDDKWYISIPQDVAEERLVKRHLETWTDAKIRLWGEGREGALKKTRASDLKNFLWVQERSPRHANVIIEN